MAGADYLKCDCGERLLYDPDGVLRERLHRDSQEITCGKCVRRMIKKIKTLTKHDRRRH